MTLFCQTPTNIPSLISLNNLDFKIDLAVGFEGFERPTFMRRWQILGSSRSFWVRNSHWVDGGRNDRFWPKADIVAAAQMADTQVAGSRPSMKHLKGFALGFAAASAVPPVIFSLFTPLSGTLDLRSAAVTFLVAYPISLFAMALLGLPTFLIFRRLGLFSWWLVAVAGVVNGILFAALIRLPSHPDLWNVVSFGMIGAVTALVFRLVWAICESSSGNRHLRDA